MSTKFLSPGWRMPRNANQSKQSNYSMDFAANDSIAVNGTSLQFSGSTSFSAWFKMDGSTTVDQRNIIGKGLEPNLSFFIRVHKINGDFKLRFQIQTSTGSSIRVWDASSPTVTADVWHHTVGVFDVASNQLKLYYDGAEVSGSPVSLSGATNINNISSDLKIGVYDNNFYDFLGQITEVSIFDYALSPSQVTTLYGTGSAIGNPMALPRTPIAYYPLGTSAYNGEYLAENNAIGDYVFKIQSVDRISTGAINLGYQFTVSFWFQRTVTGEYRLFNITNSAGDSNTRYLVDIVYPGSNQVFSHITDTSGFQSIVDSNIPLNSWIHCAYTRNGRDSNIYLSYNGGFNKNSGANSMQFPVGQETTNTYIVDLIQSIPGDGFLSNVNYFTSILTLSEIETLYNYGSPIQTLANIPQNSNLKAWYKLDASATYDSSTTTWTIPDDSTNSNDGTSSGMTQANLVQSDLQTVAPYSKYAMDFDGIDDWINIPSFMSNLPSNDIYTISTWIKTNSDTNVAWGSSNTGSALLYAYVTNGTKLGIARGSVARVDISDALTVGEWANVVAVFDTSTNLKIYINNVFIQDVTVGSLGAVTDDFKIGGGLNAYPLDCSQSNVSIWNTALTSSQVKEIYNQGLPGDLNSHSAYSNLISWWQLGENSSYVSGWTFADEVGSNDGTGISIAETALVNGVGTTANGVSTGMSEGNLVSDAPYSTANAISSGMAVTARGTDVP